MKNIKLLLLFILSIAITSCSDDDDSRTFVDSEVKTSLVGTITTNRTMAAPGTTVNFTYTLPQSFSVESTLEVKAVSNVSLNGSAFETVTFITVPAGQTTGVGSITMPGSSDNLHGFDGLANHSTITMTGIALTQPEDGSIADPYVITSEPLVLSAFDLNAPFMTANESTLLLSLDWAGPYASGNDVDLYVINSANANIESSETGDRFEGDFFNNPANENHPDGDYRVVISIWTSVDDTPIPWRLVLTHPDSTVDVYEGTVDPADGSTIPVGLTKTTDSSGNVTYTTYTL